MKINKAEINKHTNDDYLTRKLETEIKKYIDTPEVLVIYGARQVGKSTMIWNIAKELVNKYPIHYYSVNFEMDPDLLDPDRLISVLASDLDDNEKTILIIDEAQRIKNIGLFIKEIYDRKLPLKIILTGSASFAIKSDLKEPLTGRKFEFQLNPFSIEEIFNYEGIELRKTMSINTKLGKILDNYLVYGGYPQVFFTQNPELKTKRLKEIVNTYINKDLVELFAIDTPNEVRIVTNYIAENIGNLLSIEKISNLGGVTRTRVEKIITALQQTFVVDKIYPYSTDKFKEVSRTPKIYFHDVGLRNAFLDRLDQIKVTSEIGHIFENSILNQLTSQYSIEKIKYWRNINQTEVDFVIEDEGNLHAIETKYSWNSENHPKALTNFVNKYDADGKVISKDNYWEYLSK
jgi:hypothetical protein